jgi:hypothetical protein
VRNNKSVRLECLEFRLAPATVTSAGGNLLISAQVGTLYVEAVPAGTGAVRVHDSATDKTYLGPFARVRVTDTPGDDQVWVTATATPLTAALELRGGRGNDLFEVGGVFNGNVSAVGNTGNLQVYFETSATTVNGNLSFTGGSGTGALGVSGVDFLLTGNLSVNSVASSSMQLWLGDFGATGSHQDVMGSVNYLGGAGDDAVLLYTFSGGDMSLTFGGGINVFADTPDCLYSSFVWSGGPNTNVYLFGTVA